MSQKIIPPKTSSSREVGFLFLHETMSVGTELELELNKLLIDMKFLFVGSCGHLGGKVTGWYIYLQLIITIFLSIQYCVHSSTIEYCDSLLHCRTFMGDMRGNMLSRIIYFNVKCVSMIT